MSRIDLGILIVYLGLVVSIGFIVKRMASRGIESYFLGGRRLPWWMIAMSGSSSYFDITGTMWIVSIFVAYGFNGFWIQWMWGFLIAAFYLAFMGKWIRRSGVVTGAEWMIHRFGPGRQGDAARLAYTLFAVLTLTTFIGYTAVGMGKFGSAFLPVAEWFPGLSEQAVNQVCATLIIGVTGAYVVVGGFTGLTIVEFIQTIILTAGALIIAWLGYRAFDEGLVSEALRQLAQGNKRIVHVAPESWYSIVPPWRIADGSDMYALFGLVVITFLMKGLLLGASGPEQLYDFQKFLATRNTREASLAGMLWGVCHTVRFPMAMAIAIMGILMVARGATEDVISAGVPSQVTPRDVPEEVIPAEIPSQVTPREVPKEVDPEKVLPMVISDELPPVLTGVAVAALISAFMATFSAMVNGAASYLIRDIYQRYIRPEASDRHYVRASYLASVLMILVGIGISFMSQSISAMITWILGFLGSAVLVPNVLRWYWWRLNGYGFAAGIFTAMALSLAQTLLDPWIAGQMGLATVPVYYVVPVLALSSALACVVVTLLTSPTPMDRLAHFYRTTQPAGAWGPVARQVAAETPDFRKERFAPDLFALVIGLAWLGAMYVGPSYLVARRWTETAGCGVIVLLGSVILARTWYRRLPAPGENHAQANAK
jgi:Na+/proline symporter